MTRNRIYIISYIMLALTSGVIARIVLTPLGSAVVESGSPVVIGTLNGANISVHVGDISVPNRLIPIPGEATGWRLDARLRFWDAFLLTAPVPKLMSTEGGVEIQVPWTLLPRSVVSTVRQLDPQFSDRLEEWLELKESPAEWHFERLAEMHIPTESKYYSATAVRRIYAISMFEFVRDLGGDYKQNLTRAISSAVKEVVERSSAKGDQKLAVPALAAAEHVVEQYLVVSYEDSYDAILHGISRASGTPSEIILVVWHELIGHPELSSALQGLSRAMYRRLPEWSERRKAVFAGAAIVGFLAGVLGAFLMTPKHLRSSWFTFVIGLVAVVPVIASYWYLDVLLKNTSVASSPGRTAMIVTLLCCVVGHFLQTKGQLAFGKRKGSAA